MTKAPAKPDPFAAFRLPPGVTDGVEIALGNTGAVFKCRLPSAANEDYQAMFMSALPRHVSDDGELRVEDLPVAELHALRRTLFAQHCVIGATGLPGDMTPAAFFAEYPRALGAIHDEAERLARVDDDLFQEALGNLDNGPDGPRNGRVN